MTIAGACVAQAFKQGVKHRKVNNTWTDGTNVWFWQTRIAWRDDSGTIHMTTDGWNTVTTRDRLNGICAAFGSPDRFHSWRSLLFFGKREITQYQTVRLGGPLTMQVWEAERRIALANREAA